MGNVTCHRPHLHSLNSSVEVARVAAAAAVAAGEVSENNCQVAAKLERAKLDRKEKRERERKVER